MNQPSRDHDAAMMLWEGVKCAAMSALVIEIYILIILHYWYSAKCFPVAGFRGSVSNFRRVIQIFRISYSY